MSSESIKAHPSLNLSLDQNPLSTSLSSTESTIKPRPLHTSTVEDIEWRYMQSFGDDGTSDDDLVTALAFDPSGNYVVVGDKAGRICVFEAVSTSGTIRDQISSVLENDPTIPYPQRTMPNSRRKYHGIPPAQDYATLSLQSYMNQTAHLKHLACYPIGSRHTPSEHYKLRYLTPYAQDPNHFNFGIPLTGNGSGSGSSSSSSDKSLYNSGLGSSAAAPELSDRSHDHDHDHEQDHEQDHGHPSSGTNTGDASSSTGGSATTLCTLPSVLEYRFRHEYQGHESEFDSLRSTDTDPRVTSISWLSATPNSQSLLSSSDKSIKLWNLRDRNVPSTSAGGPGPGSMQNAQRGGSSFITDADDYSLPNSDITGYTTIPYAQCTQVYKGGHTYHINSVSALADRTTFVSCDELTVNLWHMEHPDQSFLLVNLRPASIEEVMEIATRVSAHPTNPHLLALSTSRACTRILDTRLHSTSDIYAKSLEISEEPLHKTFFSEIIHCVSDSKFMNSERHLVSRDFYNIHVWDLAMEHQPIMSIPVHPHLRSHTCDLYENDCLFDQFRVDISPDDQQIITGSYHNQFIIHNLRTNTTKLHEAGVRAVEHVPVMAPSVDSTDFLRKALHVAWHPKLDTVAVAGINKLYVYHGYDH